VDERLAVSTMFAEDGILLEQVPPRVVFEFARILVDEKRTAENFVGAINDFKGEWLRKYEQSNYEKNYDFYIEPLYDGENIYVRLKLNGKEVTYVFNPEEREMNKVGLDDAQGIFDENTRIKKAERIQKLRDDGSVEKLFTNKNWKAIGVIAGLENAARVSIEDLKNIRKVVEKNKDIGVFEYESRDYGIIYSKKRLDNLLTDDEKEKGVENVLTALIENENLARLRVLFGFPSGIKVVVGENHKALISDDAPGSIMEITGEISNDILEKYKKISGESQEAKLKKREVTLRVPGHRIILRIIRKIADMFLKIHFGKPSLPAMASIGEGDSGIIKRVPARIKDSLSADDETGASVFPVMESLKSKFSLSESEESAYTEILKDLTALFGERGLPECFYNDKKLALDLLKSLKVLGTEELKKINDLMGTGWLHSVFSDPELTQEWIKGIYRVLDKGGLKSLKKALKVYKKEMGGVFDDRELNKNLIIAACHTALPSIISGSLKKTIKYYRDALGDLGDDRELIEQWLKHTWNIAHQGSHELLKEITSRISFDFSGAESKAEYIRRSYSAVNYVASRKRKTNKTRSSPVLIFELKKRWKTLQLPSLDDEKFVTKIQRLFDSSEDMIDKLKEEAARGWEYESGALTNIFLKSKDIKLKTGAFWALLYSSARGSEPASQGLKNIMKSYPDSIFQKENQEGSLTDLMFSEEGVVFIKEFIASVDDFEKEEAYRAFPDAFARLAYEALSEVSVKLKEKAPDAGRKKEIDHFGSSVSEEARGHFENMINQRPEISFLTSGVFPDFFLPLAFAWVFGHFSSNYVFYEGVLPGMWFLNIGGAEEERGVSREPQQLEEIIKEIEAFGDWESCREWMLKIAYNSDVSYREIFNVLLKLKKAKKSWDFKVTRMDLARRLSGYLSEYAPEGGFGSWEVLKDWLGQGHMERLEEENNKKLQRDTEHYRELSYVNVVQALWESGMIGQNWSRQAAALDFAQRNRSYFERHFPGKGFYSFEKYRDWLIKHRRTLSEYNIKKADKSLEIGEEVAYATIHHAFKEAGLVQEWSHHTSAMDYVRNNWNGFYKEMSRCLEQDQNLENVNDADELYKILRRRFNRELFHAVKSNKNKNDIRELREVYENQEEEDYDEAARSPGIENSEARKLKSHVEGKKRPLSPETFERYLREFCRTWVDIVHRGEEDPELSRHLRLSIGVDSTGKPICEEERLKNQINPVLELLRSYEGLSESEKKELLGVIKELRVVFGELGLPDVFYEADKFNMELLKIIEKMGIKDFMKLVDMAGRERIFAAIEEDPARVCSILEYFTKISMVEFNRIMKEFGIDKFGEQFIQNPEDLLKILKVSNLEINETGSEREKLLQLEEIIKEMDPFQDWIWCKIWMKEVVQRLDLLFEDVLTMLANYGKAKKKWNIHVWNMDFNRKIITYYDRHAPAGGFGSWPELWGWLEEHRENIKAEMNKVPGIKERIKEDISYKAIVDALWSAGRIERDWRWRASALDRFERLKPLIPEKEFSSLQELRRWLTVNRRRLSAFNMAVSGRKPRIEKLSYSAIIDALREAEAINKWQRYLMAMDFVEKNWGLFYEEMMRCIKKHGNIAKVSEENELYEILIKKFNRELFLSKENQQRKKQGLSSTPGQDMYRLYLKEFCRTWIDIVHNGEKDPELSRHLRFSIGVDSTGKPISEDERLKAQINPVLELLNSYHSLSEIEERELYELIKGLIGVFGDLGLPDVFYEVEKLNIKLLGIIKKIGIRDIKEFVDMVGKGRFYSAVEENPMEVCSILDEIKNISMVEYGRIMREIGIDNFRESFIKNPGHLHEKLKASIERLGEEDKKRKKLQILDNFIRGFNPFKDWPSCKAWMEKSVQALDISFLDIIDVLIRSGKVKKKEWRKYAARLDFDLVIGSYYDRYATKGGFGSWRKFRHWLKKNRKIIKAEIDEVSEEPGYKKEDISYRTIFESILNSGKPVKDWQWSATGLDRAERLKPYFKRYLLMEGLYSMRDFRRWVIIKRTLISAYNMAVMKTSKKIAYSTVGETLNEMGVINEWQSYLMAMDFVEKNWGLLYEEMMRCIGENEKIAKVSEKDKLFEILREKFNSDLFFYKTGQDIEEEASASYRYEKYLKEFCRTWVNIVHRAEEDPELSRHLRFSIGVDSTGKPICEEERLKAQINPVVELLNSYHSLSESEKKELVEITEELKGIFGELGLPDFFYEYEKFNIELLKAVKRLGIGKFKEFVDIVGIERVFIAVEENPVELCLILEEIKNISMLELNKIMLFVGIDKFKEYFMKNPGHFRNILITGREEISYKDDKPEKFQKLKEFIIKIEPFKDWPSCKDWMRKIAQRLDLSFAEILDALVKSGKAEKSWRRYAAKLDFDWKICAYYDEHPLKDGFGSWPKFRDWLIKHRKKIKAEINEVSEEPGYEKKDISYTLIVSILVKSERLGRIWLSRAFLLDLADRLKPYFKRYLPTKGFYSIRDFRRWMIIRRNGISAYNMAGFERKKVFEKLSYSAINGALREAEAVNKEKENAEAIDYVQNNWGLFYEEMMRCIGESGKLAKVSEEDKLYKILRGKFNSELFLSKIGQGLKGKKPASYIYKKYLKEFCRTWVDIVHRAEEDPELSRHLRFSIGVDSTGKPICEEERLKAQIHPVVELLNSYHGLSESEKKALVEITEELRVIFGELGLPDFFYKYEKFNIELLKAVKRLGIGKFKEFVDTVGKERVFIALEENPIEVCFILEEITYVSPDRFKEIMELARSYEFREQFVNKPKSSRNMLTASGERVSEPDDEREKFQELEELIKEIETFKDWPSCMDWMRKISQRLDLSFTEILNALVKSGKAEKKWSRYASYMDFAEWVIGPYYDRNALRSSENWPELRAWLKKHRKYIIAENYKRKYKGKRHLEKMSYDSIVGALWISGRISRDWTSEAEVFEFSETVASNFAKSFPEGGFSNHEELRRYLIMEFMTLSDIFSEIKQKEREKCSYLMIYAALREFEIFNKWESEITAMDYVQNNWGVFYDEMSRCIEEDNNLADVNNLDELYESLRERFNRELFYCAKDVKEKVSLEEETFLIYLKEFCRTWIDIVHREEEDPELSRKLRFNIGVDSEGRPLLADELEKLQKNPALEISRYYMDLSESEEKAFTEIIRELGTFFAELELPDVFHKGRVVSALKRSKFSLPGGAGFYRIYKELKEKEFSTYSLNDLLKAYADNFMSLLSLRGLDLRLLRLGLKGAVLLGYLYGKGRNIVHSDSEIQSLISNFVNDFIQKNKKVQVRPDNMEDVIKEAEEEMDSMIDSPWRANIVVSRDARLIDREGKPETQIEVDADNKSVKFYLPAEFMEGIKNKSPSNGKETLKGLLIYGLYEYAAIDPDAQLISSETVGWREGYNEYLKETGDLRNADSFRSFLYYENPALVNKVDAIRREHVEKLHLREVIERIKVIIERKEENIDKIKGLLESIKRGGEKLFNDAQINIILERLYPHTFSERLEILYELFDLKLYKGEVFDYKFSSADMAQIIRSKRSRREVVDLINYLSEKGINRGKDVKFFVHSGRNKNEIIEHIDYLKNEEEITEPSDIATIMRSKKTVQELRESGLIGYLRKKGISNRHISNIIQTGRKPDELIKLIQVLQKKGIEEGKHIYLVSQSARELSEIIDIINLLRSEEIKNNSSIVGIVTINHRIKPETIKEYIDFLRNQKGISGPKNIARIIKHRLRTGSSKEKEEISRTIDYLREKGIRDEYHINEIMKLSRFEEIKKRVEYIEGIEEFQRFVKRWGDSVRGACIKNIITSGKSLDELKKIVEYYLGEGVQNFQHICYMVALPVPFNDIKVLRNIQILEGGSIKAGGVEFSRVEAEKTEGFDNVIKTLRGKGIIASSTRYRRHLLTSVKSYVRENMIWYYNSYDLILPPKIIEIVGPDRAHPGDAIMRREKLNEIRERLKPELEEIAGNPEMPPEIIRDAGRLLAFLETGEGMTVEEYEEVLDDLLKKIIASGLYGTGKKRDSPMSGSYLLDYTGIMLSLIEKGIDFLRRHLTGHGIYLIFPALFAGLGFSFSAYAAPDETVGKFAEIVNLMQNNIWFGPGTAAMICFPAVMSIISKYSDIIMPSEKNKKDAPEASKPEGLRSKVGRELEIASFSKKQKGRLAGYYNALIRVAPEEEKHNIISHMDRLRIAYGEGSPCVFGKKEVYPADSFDIAGSNIKIPLKTARGLLLFSLSSEGHNSKRFLKDTIELLGVFARYSSELSDISDFTYDDYMERIRAKGMDIDYALALMVYFNDILFTSHMVKDPESEEFKSFVNDRLRIRGYENKEGIKEQVKKIQESLNAERRMIKAVLSPGYVSVEEGEYFTASSGAARLIQAIEAIMKLTVGVAAAPAAAGDSALGIKVHDLVGAGMKNDLRHFFTGAITEDNDLIPDPRRLINIKQAL